MKNKVKKIQRLKSVDVSKGRYEMRIPIEAIKDLFFNFIGIECYNFGVMKEELYDLKAFDNLYYNAVIDENLPWSMKCDFFRIVIDQKKVDADKVETLQNLEDYSIHLGYVDSPKISLYVPDCINFYKNVSVNGDLVEITIREKRNLLDKIDKELNTEHCCMECSLSKISNLINRDILYDEEQKKELLEIINSDEMSNRSKLQCIGSFINKHIERQ